MKRIMLITHGTLGEGFLSSMKIICGQCEHIDTLSLGVEETIEALSTKAEQVMNTYQDQDTIIVLTDLAIGTTTKCMFPFLEKENVYLISGVNLALLLSIYLSKLDKDPFLQLKELVEEAKTTMLFINDQLRQQAE